MWKLRYTLRVQAAIDAWTSNRSSGDGGHPGQRVTDCAIGSFRSEGDALYRDHLNVIDANERERGTQVGVLEVELSHRALAVDATAGQDEIDLLALNQPFWSLCGVTE